MKAFLYFSPGVVITTALTIITFAAGWPGFSANREPGPIAGTIAPWAYKR